VGNFDVNENKIANRKRCKFQERSGKVPLLYTHHAEGLVNPKVRGQKSIFASFCQF
jgi:hypothetical protein